MFNFSYVFVALHDFPLARQFLYIVPSWEVEGEDFRCNLPHVDSIRRAKTAGRRRRLREPDQLPDYPVILCMASDPEPDEIVAVQDGHRSVGSPHTG